ncbi:MAG: hypothetical protein V5A91_04640, partial [Candidatus Accumulibacter necessarius]
FGFATCRFFGLESFGLATGRFLGRQAVRLGGNPSIRFSVASLGGGASSAKQTQHEKSEENSGCDQQQDLTH